MPMLMKTKEGSPVTNVWKNKGWCLWNKRSNPISRKGKNKTLYAGEKANDVKMGL